MSSLYGFSVIVPFGKSKFTGFSIILDSLVNVRTKNSDGDLVTGMSVELYQDDVLIDTISNPDGVVMLGELSAGTYEISTSNSDRRQSFVFDGVTPMFIDFIILGITKNYRVRAKLSDIGDYPSDYSNTLTVRV